MTTIRTNLAGVARPNGPICCACARRAGPSGGRFYPFERQDLWVAISSRVAMQACSLRFQPQEFFEPRHDESPVGTQAKHVPLACVPTGLRLQTWRWNPALKRRAMSLRRDAAKKRGFSFSRRGRCQRRSSHHRDRHRQAPGLLDRHPGDRTAARLAQLADSAAGSVVLSDAVADAAAKRANRVARVLRPAAAPNPNPLPQAVPSRRLTTGTIERFNMPMPDRCCASARKIAA